MIDSKFQQNENIFKIMNDITKDEIQTILEKLKSSGSPENIAGMARFGINPENTFGVRIPVLRKLAKEIGKNHLP